MATQTAKRPQCRMSSAIARGRRRTSPQPSRGTKRQVYRLDPRAVYALVRYQPYLRMARIPKALIPELVDPQRWEFYLVGGDTAGPRIVRRSLDRGQVLLAEEVILLAGSRFLVRHSLLLRQNARLIDPKHVHIPPLGLTGEIEPGEDPRYLAYHERHAPPRAASLGPGRLRRLTRMLGARG